MSLLPGFLRPALVVSRLALVFFILFSIYYLLFSGSAYAAPGPPNPQPCKNPLTTFDLVDNYITDEDGGAPITFEKQVTGNNGDTVVLTSYTFSYQVDFSKLQSLFANTNSNYLEGRFQDSGHQFANILGLSSQDFNAYHGPGQKAAPKIIVDDLKKKYVEYVYNKPELAESDNQYKDIEGSGDPKTVYDLVTEFGLPNPPTSSSTEEEKQVWLSTWGRYWEKIPTAWSEFYEGEIAFHWFAGSDKALEEFQKTTSCPLRIEPPIRFVIPEFFRTTAVSDQLNLTLVPRAAQSYQDHGILDGLLGQNISTGTNLVSKTISLCWKIISQAPTEIVKTLRKIIQISLEIINPVNTAFAQEAAEDKWCIKPLLAGKVGQAPYCPLPIEEYNRLRVSGSVSCTNRDDPHKLEKDNPHVVCTFTLTWPGETNYVIQESDPFCPPPNNTLRCIKVRVWPNIRIPWLAAIWNNTFYSEEEPSLANQLTGRPGFFGFFTPRAITEGTDLDPQELLDYCGQVGDTDPLCAALGEIFDDCIAQGGTFGDCLLSTLKRLPGKVDDLNLSADMKERFIGAVDECGKEFTRDNALKPGAVQEYLGIEMNCAITPP